MSSRIAKTHVHIKRVYLSHHGHSVFKGVSVKIPRGKITVIMGPSGCGKTTLLRLIGGQATPDRGKVLVDGHDVGALTRSQLFELRRSMGRLFQSGALFSHISVFENVAFPLREHLKLPEDLLRNIVLLTLETVGLRGAHHLMPNELSGGMARRVALARAIVCDPKIMMYDEPLTGQDPISVGVLLRLIKQLNQTLGMTSVIVSHSIRASASIADYIYLLADGKVLGHGTPDEIFSSESAQVQQFVQGHPDGVVPFHYPAPSLAEDLGL